MEVQVSPNHFLEGLIQMRLEILVESGIAGLWNQRNNTRRKMSGPSLTESHEFVELSFDNSDIYLAFGLYGFCLLVSLVKFAAEIMITRIRCSLFPVV